MADTKISALPAASAALGTHEFAANEAGVSKKVTLTQINTFVEPLCNASTADQTGLASDTYLVGSSLAIVPSRLQIKTIYRCRFNVTKTAAGVATPIINVRYGTAGSTADTARLTLTHSAQTAALDEGFFEVFVTFRAVGSGTSTILRGVSVLSHENTATGLSTKSTDHVTALTSPGFDSTVANSIIGLSVNGGTSAAWTINLVQAELLNLV